MIRNAAVWERWKNEQERREPVDYWANLRIYEALYEEARLFGVFPPHDPLEGIEEKIRFARKLNVPTPSRTHGAGA